jgi:hypothetical protein
MKVYADAPARRLLQLTGDVLLAGWLLGWVLVARMVHKATMLLARPGEQVSEAGSGLADRMREAGSAVDDAPLIGDELRAPFDGAGDAADRIAAAGVAQAAAVADLAFWLSLSVAAIPILVAAAFYLPLRWRFVREASAAQRHIDAAEDLELFALRALSRQPMHRLARISADPSGAWRRGDAEVVRRLALLELRDVGLRPPA